MSMCAKRMCVRADKVISLPPNISTPAIDSTIDLMKRALVATDVSNNLSEQPSVTSEKLITPNCTLQKFVYSVKTNKRNKLNIVHFQVTLVLSS